MLNYTQAVPDFRPPRFLISIGLQQRICPFNNFFYNIFTKLINASYLLSVNIINAIFHIFSYCTLMKSSRLSRDDSLLASCTISVYKHYQV